MNVFTFWLAVDKSDTTNGCLRIVKESHKVNLSELKSDRSVLNVLVSFTHTNADIDP